MTEAFDQNKPVSPDNNPLVGKSEQEVTDFFQQTKDSLVNGVAKSINSTLTEGGAALGKISNLSTSLHQIMDGLATELAIFHEFEHHIRTGAEDLGRLWTNAESKLDEVRSVFRGKAEQLVTKDVPSSEAQESGG